EKDPRKEHPKEKKKPAAPASRRSLIIVDSFDLSGVTVRSDLGEVGFDLNELRLVGSLHYASAAGKKPGRLRYDLRPAAREGSFRLRDKIFALSRLSFRRLAATKQRPDRVTMDASVGVDDAELTVRGGLEGLGKKTGPTVALLGVARRFAGVLAKLTGRAVIDQESRLTATLSGPVTDPGAQVRVTGLGLRHGRVETRALELSARYETGVLTMDHLTTKLLGGRLTGRGRLYTGTGEWRATLKAEKLDTTKTLPKDRQEALAGTLNGWLDATGLLSDPRRGWTRFDATLDRHGRRGPLPPSIRVHGVLHASPERLDIRELAVASRLLDVSARGRFWPGKLRMDLACHAQAKQLRGFLLRLGKPPLVAAVSVVGKLDGRVMNPRFMGHATAYGIRQGPVSIRMAKAEVGLHNGTITARDAQAKLFGGTVSASARVGLYDRDVRRMYRNAHLKAKGRFAGVNSAQPTRGALRGLFQGGFEAHGPLGFLRGRLFAHSNGLRVARQHYRKAELDVRFRPNLLQIDKALVYRNPQEYVRVKGQMYTGGRISLKVKIKQLPLSVVPSLSGPHPPVSGRVDTDELTVSGTTAAPVLEGTVRLLRAAIQGVAAGDGAVQLSPGDGHTKLSGRLLSWLSIVTGKVTLGKRTAAELKLRFDDVELERYLPELRQHADTRGRASGTLALTVGDPGGVQQATLTIDKLKLKLKKPFDPFEDRQETAELRNYGKIIVHYDGHRVTVKRLILTDKQEVHRVAIHGSVGPKDSNLRIRGRVALLPLEILLGENVRRLRGVVGLDLSITGDPRDPQVQGAIYPASVKLRTTSLEGDLIVRGGIVRVSNRLLDVRGLRIVMGDDEAELNGLVHLDNFKPKRLNLSLDGRLSPKALEVVLADWVMRAQGSPSRVDLRITGTATEPDIRGKVHLGRMQLGLRGLSKELALSSGRVDFRGGTVSLHGVRGTLGDGPFELDGEVHHKGFALAGLNLRFVGENIPHRSGGTYEVSINPNVTLSGKGDFRKCRPRLSTTHQKELTQSGDPKQCYTLSGLINVVDGRYIQKYTINPVQRILSPSRTTESSEPFYADNAFLENLKLNLTVSTSGTFRVKNNIADIGLEGDVSVTGFLPQMRIGGNIDFKEGSFRIPFLRGRYSGVSGSVDFDRGRTEGRDEPYVRLSGTSTFIDRSETEHEITLTVTGYLSRLVPQWSTNTGLTSSQTLTLLVTSRTPDELRKGRSASIPNLAPLIENYLPIDLQLDLSSDFVQVYVEKKLGRFFKLRGEVEMGYSGSQRQEGMVIFKLLDRVQVVAKAKRREQGEDVTTEDDTLSGRIEVKYKIRLRGGLRRALGL
ncbi:MAG: translocation/assembly module TamB domain-containing protein, partial [bacterium]